MRSWTNTRRQARLWRRGRPWRDRRRYQGSRPSCGSEVIDSRRSLIIQSLVFPCPRWRRENFRVCRNDRCCRRARLWSWPWCRRWPPYRREPWLRCRRWSRCGCLSRDHRWLVSTDGGWASTRITLKIVSDSRDSQAGTHARTCS